MKFKCFVCATFVEADEVDAILRAFVAHGRQSHTWSYPEDAVRNYARNYAEATERLTGRRVGTVPFQTLVTGHTPTSGTSRCRVRPESGRE
jgi:hypothetical protein